MHCPLLVTIAFFCLSLLIRASPHEKHLQPRLGIPARNILREHFDLVNGGARHYATLDVRVRPGYRYTLVVNTVSAIERFRFVHHVADQRDIAVDGLYDVREDWMFPADDDNRPDERALMRFDIAGQAVNDRSNDRVGFFSIWFREAGANGVVGLYEEFIRGPG